MIVIYHVEEKEALLSSWSHRSARVALLVVLLPKKPSKPVTDHYGLQSDDII